MTIEMRRNGPVPFWTTLGSANRALAATTSPARSSSAQRLITATSPASALPAIVVVALVSFPEEPQPEITATIRTARAASVRAVTDRSWQRQVAELDRAAESAR